MRIGFLASHRGSNMQAVLEACAEGRLDAVPAVLVTNNRSAAAIQHAQRGGLGVYVLNGLTHPEPDALDIAMHDARCTMHSSPPGAI